MPNNLINLFPTFMDMAGLELEPSLEFDGASLLPLFHDETD